jgi:hypothetical protein
MAMAFWGIGMMVAPVLGPTVDVAGTIVMSTICSVGPLRSVSDQVGFARVS